MGIFSRKIKEEKKKDQSAVPVVLKAKKEEKRKDTKQSLPPVVQPSKPVKTVKAYRALLKPIISEKATIGVSLNKYVFEVSPRANKVEVKKAIEELYGVVPQAVNIINKEGERVRFGRYLGSTKNRKKAIVTLKKGETIKLYEGI